MTNPVRKGSPDWSRKNPWSDEVYVNDGSVVINAPSVRMAEYVGNIRALYYIADSLNGRAQLTFDWAVDKAFTNIAWQDSVVIGNGQGIRSSIRPFSPYLRITITPQAATTITYDLVVGSIAELGNRHVTPTDAILVSAINQPIGAGASVVVAANNGWVGRCSHQFDISVATFRHMIQVLDLAGNVTDVYHLENATAKIPDVVYVPGGHLQYRVDNVTAGAGSYTVVLMGDIHDPQ